MISRELVATIRRLYYAEHWKIGTIASELGLHWVTVRSAVNIVPSSQTVRLRKTLTDPFLEFIRTTLERHPRLRSTRIYEMVRGRGYSGSLVQLRKVVARLRPARREAFLRLRSFPGEQAQVDWAHFGSVTIGRAKRALSGFVLTLSYSRALYLEFFYDQTLESFLLGHVRGFDDLGGVPRTVLYDNLKSAVLERRNETIHFHPRLLELCAHYHFAAQPCRPARGNEKGRVERAIRYIRDSFFAARPFRSLEDLNRQALRWRGEVAHRRPWVEDDSRSVADVYAEEKPRLLSLPAHPFETERIVAVRSGKTPFVRFDQNDYSIPPETVGRQLVLVASDITIRLLDGTTEIARHRRSYDRHLTIEDPAHIEVLVESKRRAREHTPGGRLAAAAPEIEAFLAAALTRGESARALAPKLLLLLDDYGAAEFRTAIRTALARKTPRLSSVAYLLQQRARQLGRSAPLPISLDRRPDLADIAIRPHNSETYDELSRHDDEDTD